MGFGVCSPLMQSSSPTAESTVRRCRPLLGTFVEIAVPRTSATAIDAAFAAIRHIHDRMSFHEETSDLASLRRAPVGAAVCVEPETVTVLTAAIELHRLSRGLFDVTIGRRLVAAGFLPRPPSVDLRRMTGTTADLEIIDDRRVRCRKPMLIDLGGIAKGYAVDRATEVLLTLGVRHGIVNAGGDLRTFGPDTETIHLRGADDSLDGVVALADSAMASSSNRHLRRVLRGREVSPHLDSCRRSVLAPKAVTVVAPTCMMADAMTKIVLADPGMGRQLLKLFGGKIVERAARPPIQ
jgi:FAD:protein FMN transferase